MTNNVNHETKKKRLFLSPPQYLSSTWKKKETLFSVPISWPY